MLLEKLEKKFVKIHLGQSLVEHFDLVKGVHDFHLSLGIKPFLLKSFHCIFILQLAACFQNLLCVLDISPRLIVSGCSSLADVIVLFRIRLHSDLGVTSATFEIEAVDSDSKVVLV